MEFVKREQVKKNIFGNDAIKQLLTMIKTNECPIDDKTIKKIKHFCKISELEKLLSDEWDNIFFIDRYGASSSSLIISGGL
jgi:hypothetical protein